MALIDLDLVSAFDRAFGFTPNQFDLSFNGVTGDTAGNGRKEYGIAGAPYYGINKINGQEYFMPGFITYPDDSGTMQKWELPFPIVSVTGRKTIIETPLTQRRGTVKELIQQRDYIINIKGLIIAPTKEFPESDVISLKKMFEQNIALKLQHPISDIFLMDHTTKGSDLIVITDLAFPEVKGVKNVRPYELTLVSDAPFSLVSVT